VASPVAFTPYASLGQGLVLDWNGDGTYTPRCEICLYSGKPREVHSHGVNALRKHAQTVGHKDLVSSKEMSDE
jgi:hypothetical protein